MRAAFVAAGLLAASSCWAQEDPKVTGAFDHFYNLEYGDAVRTFRSLTDAQPQSAEAWNHLAQALFYSSLFDAGMMGSNLIKDNNAIIFSHKLKLSPERDSDLRNAMSRARALSEARLQSNSSDAPTLYQLGVTYALHANYLLTVKHTWISGLADANQSRRLHEQVLALAPSDVDARLIPGMHEYMVGTLPAVVSFAARTAGFPGNREHGLARIEDVAAHGRGTKIDAQILLGVVYRREKRSRDAIAGMRRLSEQFPRNFLFPIELGHLYLDAGDRAAAAREVAFIQKQIDAKAPGYGPERVETIRAQEADLLKRLGKR